MVRADAHVLHHRWPRPTADRQLVLDPTPDDPSDAVDLVVFDPGGTLVSLSAQGQGAGSWAAMGANPTSGERDPKLPTCSAGSGAASVIAASYYGIGWTETQRPSQAIRILG